MEAEKRPIVLHDVHGFGDRFLLLDGIDQNGKVWLFRRQSGDCTCSLCGEVVRDGWVSFDSGNAVCESHVTIKGRVG
jgi:hypothetical protein